MLIDRLSYALGLDTTGLKRGWYEANTILTRADKRLNMFAYGGAATLAVAIGSIGAAATKMAADYELAMAEVATITDLNVKGIKRLGDELLGLYTRTPVQSVQQLVKGYYQVISSGVQDTAQALNVLEVASKAATAGLSNIPTTVDAITNVLNAYNKEAEEAGEISDTLFTAIREGKLTMDTLAPTIGTVVSSAALAGVSFEEVAAAMAAMTKAGYSADESATSLNRLFLSIVNAQDDAKEAAKELGIEWSVAGMRAKGFQQFIKELNDKAGDNIELLQRIVPEIRAFRAASVVAGTQAKGFTRIMGEMDNKLGATVEALNKMMATQKMLWQVQKNRIHVAMIKLGGKILPAVKDMLKLVADAFEGVGLAGETEAKKLQKEWWNVGTAISSAADIMERANALQKAMSQALKPGATIKEMEDTIEFLKVFPFMSEKAQAVMKQQVLTAYDLVKAAKLELEYYKSLSDKRKKLQEIEKGGEVKYIEFIKDANGELKARFVTEKDIAEMEKEAYERMIKTLKAMKEIKNVQDGIAEGARLSLEYWNAGALHVGPGSPAYKPAQRTPIPANMLYAVPTHEVKVALSAFDELRGSLLNVSDEAFSFRGILQQIDYALYDLNVKLPDFAETLFRMAQDWTSGNYINVMIDAATWEKKLIDRLAGFNQTARESVETLSVVEEEARGMFEKFNYYQLILNKQDLERTIARAKWDKEFAKNFRPVPELETQLKVINELLNNFGKFTDDFAGAVKRWNYEVSVLNIDDPAEKLKRFRQIMLDTIGVELPESAEKAQKKVKDFIDYLNIGESAATAWALAFGTQAPGPLTGEQLRQLVEQFSNLINAVQEAAQSTASGAQITTRTETVAFTRTKQITFRQADVLIEAAWSVDQQLRNIYRLLDARLPADFYNKYLGSMAAAFNIFATVVNVNTQNARIDISKATVNIAGDESSGSEQVSRLSYDEINRGLRAQGII